MIRYVNVYNNQRALSGPVAVASLLGREGFWSRVPAELSTSNQRLGSVISDSFIDKQWRSAWEIDV